MTIRAAKFTPEVLLSAPRRSPAVPNSSGTLAVYTQTTYSFSSHSKTNEIRVIDLESGHSSVVTSDAGASNPQWLDDGDYLVWLKEKDNGNTSFIIGDARDPGRSYTAGTVPGPVSDLKLTTIEPGKTGFVVSGKANPDGTLYNPKDAKKPLSSGKYYTSIWVRHWDSYVVPQKNSLWYGLLQSPSPTASDKVKRYAASGLTNLLAVSGLDGVETPIPPFGGTDHFAISPNAVAFIAKDPALNPATHTACILYYCPMPSWTDLSIREAKVCQMKGLEGAMSSPVLSKDGSSIAFLVQKKDGHEADKNRIIFVPNPWSGQLLEVFESKDGQGQWSLSPSSISWAQDDKSLFVTVEEKGRGVLYQLSIENILEAKPSDLKKLTSVGVVTGVSPLAKDSNLLLVSSSSLVEPSIYTIIDPESPDEAKVLSSASRGGSALGLSRSQVDEIWYKGEKSDIHAFVIKPSNFNPDEKYPLAYLIHGGPEAAWNDSWSTRWNPAVFAEQGYVVVTPNPTGSTGYGQEFTDAIQGSWGGLPYLDLERGFDYIKQNLKYVDTDRAVALGASYGGYMMNWIQGHPLGRKFKALVTHDGVFNMVAQTASEEQYFPLADLKGPLWKVPDEWHKWDPSRFTANWETPHLIIHNELDYRLTIAEGLAAFNILQMRGVESAFLTFPDENHWVLQPENSLVWHYSVINWINKYVGLPALSTTHHEAIFPRVDATEKKITSIPLR
ncbi:dipeptidyl aminopeptidases-like protein [Talaromyces proteolyticus]|uniref:Dipeptidyl-peptidase V n=1 Tax=Talaromyces proteolyticus TaxID=1131652 RepID=A0AAD4KIH9_9EURO|nr:dipeptidyl aminopeptidases-like protein [Talaromyces proteolyticus]KAH8689111.1 dipeptidyl aminopeptidases-like protein [Talaromyces proteolyticus]